MIQQGADQPTGDSSTQIAPDLWMEADRLRHLSDPKLTAPIYGESRDNASQRRQFMFFGRLRDALLSYKTTLSIRIQRNYVKLGTLRRT